MAADARLRLALALTGALLFALAVQPRGAEAQTPPPAFLRESFTYTLDEGADGSGAAVAIGTPLIVADAADTTSCAISAQTVTGGSAPSPALFAIDSFTCAITYTGSGETRSSSRQSFTLTVGVDGDDAGNDADDTIAITVEIVNAATDKAVLEAFYDATAGASWTTSTNWKTSAALNTWYGVSTNIDGRVTDLVLLRNNLGGVLPAALGRLSKLHALRLEGAPMPLFGHIPPELGNLSAMQSLILRGARLTGGIPPELGQLTALQRLDLRQNRLTGPIPPGLGDLPDLRNILLVDNQLSGGIPGSLGNLTNLNTLLLHNNALTGAIPSSLGQPTGMRRLSLNDNRLSGGIPDSLGNLTALEELLLHNNALTGAIPTTLGQLTALADLQLHNNRLSGPIPDLGGTALTALFLYNNQLSALPTAWPAGLRSLWAFNNQITGAIPALPTTLTSVFLHGNQLTGMIPAALGNLVNLQYLYLSGNQLTGDIPDLSSLTSLARLLLHDNRLTGPIPDLSALTSLRYLYLGGNELTGDIPAWLPRMTGLTRLVLHDNQLTGDIPDLSALTSLQFLYLGDNQWTGGDVPAWLTRMTGLTRLALHESQLTGPIPDLSALSGLQHLYLDDNRLTGSVPASLATLTDMTVLRLSGNADLECVSAARLLAWIDGIAAKAGGEASVAVCRPVVPAVPSSAIALTVAEEGDAPDGAAYALRLECGTSLFTPTLAAGERYTAFVVAGSTCSLTVTDRQGAAAVLGEFADQPVDSSAEFTITATHRRPPTPAEERETARLALDQTLMAGMTFARWQGPATPIADVAPGLTLRITVVYQWDARAQDWRSWFPGGEGTGVNTLASFERGGIYLAFAEAR